MATLKPNVLDDTYPRKAPRDTVVIKYDEDGRPLTFRRPGSPAGSFPHTPWHHCVLYDQYERVNVWSHGLPGIFFFMFGLTKLLTVSSAVWTGFGTFALCAATTHLLSALTHVYPDDHVLEKVDHLGIVVLIMGTPMSTLMIYYHRIAGRMFVHNCSVQSVNNFHHPVRHPQDDFAALYGVMLAMIICAFLPPLPRSCSFAAGTIYIVGSNFTKVGSKFLLMELALYAIGMISFLRNGGHRRWPGFADHHILHYMVTVSCFIHWVHLYAELPIQAIS